MHWSSNPVKRDYKWMQMQRAGLGRARWEVVRRAHNVPGAD